MSRDAGAERVAESLCQRRHPCRWGRARAACIPCRGDAAAVLDALADDAQAKVERVEALAAEFESEVDWSAGRWDYGDNAAWESAAHRLRAALNPEPTP